MNELTIKARKISRFRMGRRKLSAQLIRNKLLRECSMHIFYAKLAIATMVVWYYSSHGHRYRPARALRVISDGRDEMTCSESVGRIQWFSTHERKLAGCQRIRVCTQLGPRARETARP